MISNYGKNLFEQQTPYLQWLKERKEIQEISKDVIKGKHIAKLPFFSCEDKIEQIVTQPIDVLYDIDFVLFYGANGFLEQKAKYFFAEYFEKHEEVVIAYADEDYLGDLRQFYGEKVKETEYSYEYQFGETQYYRGEPWFKPDYSPDTLRSFFYFGNIFAIRGAVLADMVAKEKQLSIYEMVLILIEKYNAAGHISEVLFTNEVKMKDTPVEVGRDEKTPIKNESIISKVDTKRISIASCIKNKENSLISIVIPSKDNANILKRCLLTMVEYTDYPYYEIILVDNGSSEKELMCIRELIAQVQEDYDLKWADAHEPMEALSIQHIYQKAEFNFSKMCNLGAKAAKGELLLFLNDDMEIIDSSWLRGMKEQAKQTHTGAVGAKLYYPKATESESYRIQHVGITNMGIGPAHKLAGMKDEGDLYHGHNTQIYNMLAVTAACLMIKKECFWEVGGFDEELAVAYNDVELCFKLHEKGYFNVQKNDVVLLHHESLSRGHDTSLEKKARLEHEKALLYKKHPLLRNKDPFYSEHLVQWKKDVAYSCNYLYPCDKINKPRLLNKKEIEKLPKEHHNKYIRKLTGDNLSMLEIDRAEVSVEDGTVTVQGWYVMRGRDNALLEKKLLLRNVMNNEIYEIEIYPMLRYDVEDLFCEDERKALSRTKNVALAGIQCIMDRNMLECGRYQIGIQVDTRKGFFASGKVCWKKDCIINV